VQKQYVLAAFYRMTWMHVHGRDFYPYCHFANLFLKRRLPFTEEGIIFTLRFATAGVMAPSYVNFTGFLKSVEAYIKKEGLSPALAEALQVFLDAEQKAEPDKDRDKIRLAAQAIFVNAGGVIQVATEILKVRDANSFVEGRLMAMREMLDAILVEARARNTGPESVADEIVERRLFEQAA